ncbi:arabinogalactan endo-1,4-beta-galactosidase [Fomitiporia mediterranea MF3/22]|uniref:arabinogalactan endo-1,4-beta-galactosidase n=1 Tax=Fomitiporia mediterranea (strain MF3/22) TaxID=694068 RepID=UPI0004407C28|nr:arabinogalactan endo-1,4-beta-galactosidase [Fomitiporia mediterranea MF3/22]EJC99940.1 arabinogalactan endo-1,4-beta-galactosidase [Fomitiporia mediterranea MF3/22]
MRLVRFVLPLLSFVSFSLAALTLNGADFSSLSLLESQGISYTDGGSKRPFETILSDHGFKLARIRIWTAGTYTQDYGIALAKRAKAAGMKILVDLHYSDTWADPGHQAIPSSWPQDLDGLNTQIWTYTKDLVTAFSNAGVPIDYIQVGNEINDGLLWPTGRISVNGFHPASELLHSAVSGVRAASSTAKTVVHIANGWDSGGVDFFFGGIFVSGALSTSDVDVLAFSFYPFYDTRATLNALQSTLTSVVSQFNKDILIAETDWPVSCSSVTLSETSIPKSAAGQQTWVHDVENVLTGLSGGHGLGVVYWEPGWIGNAGLGSACADALLVDSSGATRSSINLF